MSLKSRSMVVPKKPDWTVRVNAEIRRTISAGSDAACVAAMFGLSRTRRERLYDNFELTIRPGEIIAVVGPSGSGKSVLLRHVARQVPDAIRLRADGLRRCEQPAVSMLRGGELSQRLEVLSRCGLAEATALVTAAKGLSGGQLHRLALALALHRARRRNRPTLVVADEFAALLDRTTADMLCRRLRRLVSGSAVAILLATPRIELLAELHPDGTIIKSLGGPACTVKPTRRCKNAPAVSDPGLWAIRRGTIADYKPLAGFHYLAGPPAAHKRVYVIRRPRRGSNADRLALPELAGVLVVSPPVLQCRGRNVATDGRYVPSHGLRTRRQAAALLNAEIETISRVVVHPIFRGCGLAVRLVRHALGCAETPWMEALAAMGGLHPFLEKAGMTAHGRFCGCTKKYFYYLSRTRRAQVTKGE
ncbi:MAG: ATP-binding cassette domain-containing protein [Planctomycetota bacterium]|nr:ATP-binding cassette domain-containing protein [Planctomycetota bacterium]